MTTRNERLGDTLEEESDVAGTRVVADLARAFAVPAPPEVRAAVRQTLRRHPALDMQRAVPVCTKRMMFLRHRYVTIAAVALLGVALIAGGASAATSLLDRAFEARGSGTAAIGQQRLGQELDLARTVCGFTMTLQRAYADANRVVVGYTIAGPPARSFWGDFFTAPRLTSAGGQELPLGPGAGGLAGNMSSSYRSYDAAGIAVPGTALRLHLVASSVQAVEELATKHPVAVPCEKYSHVHEAMVGGHSTRWVVVGPFAFDFAVPVTSRVRVVTLHKMARLAPGAEVALERLVIAPSETRLYLRSLVPHGAGTTFGVVLQVAGQEVYAIDGVAPPVNGLWTYDFDSALYDKRGDWTVKVLVSQKTMARGNRLSARSVTLHVQVP